MIRLFLILLLLYTLASTAEYTELLEHELAVVQASPAGTCHSATEASPTQPPY